MTCPSWLGLLMYVSGQLLALAQVWVGQDALTQASFCFTYFILQKVSPVLFTRQLSRVRGKQEEVCKAWRLRLGTGTFFY